MNYQDLNSIIINRVSFSKNEIEKSNKLPQEIKQFLNEWFNEKDYIISKTSGSTGKPKEIKLKKQHMLNSALSTVHYLNVKPNSTFLLALPVAFIAGKMMLIRGMLVNANIILTEPNLTPKLPLNKTIDFAAFTPIQIENLIHEQANLVKKIHKIIIGGAPLKTSLEKQLLELNTNCYETFGMTETITHIALRKIGEKSFNTLPNISIDSGENNELIIHAPHLGIEELKTNDIIQKITSTEFKWIGRKDFIINSGGLKINPEELESQLAKELTSTAFFVHKKPHPLLGEACTLIYNRNLLEEKDIQKAIKKIASNLRPKELIPVDELIFTNTGKINRVETFKLLHHGK